MSAQLRQPRVVLAVLLLSALLGVSRVPAAQASCAEGSGPSGSPVVFAGVAQEERRGFTRFSVRQVWAGPDLAPSVWVQSGQEQPPWPVSLLQRVSSSVDADLTPGGWHVVGASEAFLTSACSVRDLPGGVTGPADRPVDVRPASADGTTGADPPIGLGGQMLSALGVIAGVAALRALVRRRRTRSR